MLKHIIESLFTFPVHPFNFSHIQPQTNNCPDDAYWDIRVKYNREFYDSAFTVLEDRQWYQTWVPPIIRRNDNPTWNHYPWWARSGDVQDILTQLNDLTWWIVQGDKACMWHSNELPRGHYSLPPKYCKNYAEETPFVNCPICTNHANIRSRVNSLMN